MKFNQMEYLDAVARNRSFHKAAKELGVSQPAITYALGKLEEELNIQLFEKGSKSDTLTPAGEIILKYANKIIADTQLMRAEIDAYSKFNEDTIAITYGLCSWITPELEKFLSANLPAQKVVMSRRNISDINRLIDEGIFDIGICFSSSVHDNHESFQFSQLEMGVILNSGSIYAAKESISAASLADRCLLLPEVETDIHSKLIQYCNKNIPNYSLSTNGWTKDFFSTCSEVRHNRNVFAFVPFSSNAIPHDVNISRLDPPLLISTSVIWLKNRYQSKEFDSILAFLRRLAAEKTDSP